MGHCSSKQQHVNASSSNLFMIDSSIPPSSITKNSVNKRSNRRRSSSSKHSSKSKRVAAEIPKSTKQNRLVTNDELDSSQSSRRTSRSNKTALTASTNSSILDVQYLTHHNIPSPPQSQPSSSTSQSRTRSGPYRSHYPQPLPHLPIPPTFAQKYQFVPGLALGHGIAGQVHQCIHRKSSKVCAVKTMTKSQIRRKDRIKREISFLMKLNHPNIIKMFDAYEDEKEVKIVTEICHGGELFDKIVENATSSKNRNLKSSVDLPQAQARLFRSQHPACFSERDAARIIYSLLSAVSYLHSNDIVHRDIKPENVLFTEKDTDKSPIKLIDFGLSIKHTKDCPPLLNTVGTSYYMAPELLDGSYDRSCDLWSIGVIAYVMLSGRPPFNGNSDEVIFRKIRRGNFRMDTSLWDGVSECAKDFITCLLDMNPRTRWTAHMALNHAWLKLGMLEDIELEQI